MDRKRTARICICASAAGLVVALLLSAGWQQAWAGQARAQFRVGIRIVEVKAAAAENAPATPEKAARTSARAANKSAQRRLPRADGSGYCVRVALGATRFRWVCN